jgi:uncharacterized protein (TIGR02145 family)
MAQNLNYAATNSKCYDNLDSNCNKYGRLYNWATAMALPASCNTSACSGQIQSKHRGVCPIGWHVPSNAEWDALYRYADGVPDSEYLYDSYEAGEHLKAASGWYSNGNGQDTYGFAALPGGGGTGTSFVDINNYGFWWSANEYEEDDYLEYAYNREMNYYDGEAVWEIYQKITQFSLRCVQD